MLPEGCSVLRILLAREVCGVRAKLGDNSRNVRRIMQYVCPGVRGANRWEPDHGRDAQFANSCKFLSETMVYAGLRQAIKWGNMRAVLDSIKPWIPRSVCSGIHRFSSLVEHVAPELV